MKKKCFDLNLSFTVSSINASIIESCLNELFRIYVYSNYDKGVLWALEMGVLFHTKGDIYEHERITWIKEAK